MNRIAVLLLVALALGAGGGERRRAVRSPATPATNSIDTHIEAKLRRDGIAAAALARDEEFLRRVTLDLTGRIPTTAEVVTFVADASAGKRTQQIDALLASDAFNDRWTLWFADLVQNVQVANNNNIFYPGRNAYHLWIQDAMRTAKPYDAMVRELLAGAGNNHVSGPANYVVRQIQRNGPEQDTFDNLAAHSGEKFLGLPLLCISCHDGQGHLEAVNGYLAAKPRLEFWRTAAFFSQIRLRRERYPDPMNANAFLVRYDLDVNPAGTYRLNTTDGNKSPRIPVAGQAATVTPAFLLDGATPRAGEDYRVAYGRILTAHPQFARATVNLLWKEMFGRGLVEPVNGFDLSKLESQASHPALLEELAASFAKNYSIRELLRTIATSHAYQRASTYDGTPPDPSYFAHRNRRRLQAEFLLDAIADATSSPNRFNVRGLGIVDRATRTADPLDGRRQPTGLFLDRCGRGDRDDVLRSNDSSIVQALGMLNDPIVTSRVAGNNNTVRRLIAEYGDPAALVEQLYLITLSRRPTDGERAIALDYLRAGGTAGALFAERVEDLQFVLLNSLEFLFV
jgi:hypothetical protein